MDTFLELIKAYFWNNNNEASVKWNHEEEVDKEEAANWTFEELDTDGNGELSKTEWLGVGPQCAPFLLPYFDKDKDDIVSRAEWLGFLGLYIDGESL